MPTQFRYATVVFLIVIGNAVGASSTHAAVSSVIAERLDMDLTPLGSERSGNADGTIPAWTGGIQTPPAGFQAGTHHINPYVGEKPLFTITRDNMAQYADRIATPQRALLEKYSKTFKMNVYSSHRSCAQPDFVYEANRKNALSGVLADAGNGVDRAIMGKPFPIPNSGHEMLWNHLLGYAGHKKERHSAAAIVAASGSYTKYAGWEVSIFHWNDPGFKTASDLNNVVTHYEMALSAPPNMAGNVVQIHEFLNRLSTPRRAWHYIPKTRRIRRAPYIAYDDPSLAAAAVNIQQPNSSRDRVRDGQEITYDSVTTLDSFGGYNGAPDRYTWTLRGRQEAYVPYNSFDLHSDKLKYDDIIQPRHINSDHVRYKLHRVWQLEALLKPSAEHVYAKRVFYQDEDTSHIVLAELYDARGELWRVQEQYSTVFYDVSICGQGMGSAYDLDTGNYILTGMINEEKPTNFNANYLTSNGFSPARIRLLSDRHSRWDN